MFETLLKSVLPRIVQDLVTTGVGALTVHGYVTADQEQATIGSVFFLTMLVLNYIIAHVGKVNAAQAGAAAALNVDPRAMPLSPSHASAIAKGKL